MSALKVKMAGRFLNRQAGRVGKSIYKSLGELITNSDDSYSRLVAAGNMEPDTLRQILVVWDKRNSEFHVVDHAEGMTDKVMEDKFGEYGKDTSGSSQGAPVRGLFGQGISDVLFFHDKGQVESIVDRYLYRCRFLSNGGDWEVDPKRTQATVNKGLRHSLRIPEGNGTVVSFRLAPNVRKPVKHFTRELERLPMLRLINSDPNKLVRYIEVGPAGEAAHDLQYQFPEGELLTSEDVTFTYEDFPPVTAHIELSRSAEPLETDEAGMLVFDEKMAVYDCTLFGLNDPSQTLFGTIRLEGARAIIIATMNQDEPEEILSDDRSGFVTHHSFYRALQKAVQPVIEAHIARPSAEPKADRLSDTQRTNQRKALDIFNALYKDMIEDITPVTKPSGDPTPPVGGIEFDRRNITATQGKTYRLGLNVNVEMIPIGSTVSLSSDNDAVVVQPDAFEVTEAITNEDGLARRLITICGSTAGESALITAAHDGYVATTVATITEETVVYPETMMFDPSLTTVRPDGAGRGHLYLNTQVIPVGSSIRFEVTDASTEILLEADQHLLTENDIAYEDVARIRVEFAVGQVGQAAIHASRDEQSATLAIRVVERKPNEPEEPQGKFSDWQFGEIGRPQCFYDSDKKSRTYGVLVVNRSHRLNQLYFGINPTKESVSKSLTGSAYLAELLLDAALDFMLSEKWQQETTSGGSLAASRDPHLYIRNYLASEKARIGPEFHRLFVDEELMRGHEKTFGESSPVATE